MEGEDYTEGMNSKKVLSINDIENEMSKWKKAHKRDFGFNTANGALDTVLMWLKKIAEEQA